MVSLNGRVVSDSNVNICRSELFKKHLKLGQCCHYLLVLTLVLFGLAMSAGTIKLYFSNAIKNKIVTNVVKQLDFPAITICNQLTAKRVPTCEIPASGYFWRYFSLLPKLEGGIWNKKLEDEAELLEFVPRDRVVRMSEKLCLAKSSNP
uniref:Uncharacterized protein n=1 Tax=Romanomermis culicivorax TaxID=13658 RepID=A0A915JY33_ROMCU